MNLAAVRIRSIPDTHAGEHAPVSGRDPRLLWSLTIDNRFVCELQVCDDVIRRLFVFDLEKNAPGTMHQQARYNIIGYRSVMFGYVPLTDTDVACMDQMCRAHINHVVLNAPYPQNVIPMHTPRRARA